MSTVDVSNLDLYTVLEHAEGVAFVSNMELYTVLEIDPTEVMVSNLDLYTILEAVPASSVGMTASVSTGTWEPAATSYTYQWRRDGVVISGATSSSYVLQEADVGAMVDCLVTAYNSFGEASLPADPDDVGPISAA